MEILYLEKMTIIEETPIYVCIFVFTVSHCVRAFIDLKL